MTLQQLQYIIALDTHRHFIKAAESCFVAQPTLTIQVKKLEDEINMLIFDRSTQPVQPTPAGRTFIEKARSVLREMNELKAMVTEEKEEVEGIHHLGIIPTLSPYILPLFINKFVENNPKTHLNIKEIQTKSIIKGLHDHSLDIGIFVTPIEDKNLRVIPLFYEPFVIFASENSKLSKLDLISSEDLTIEGLWILDEGHCFRNQVLNICGKQTASNHKNGISFESGTIETLKNMVRNKMGYTLIPELSVNPDIDNPYVKHFTNPKPVREISIVVRKSFNKEKLIDILKAEVLKIVPATFQKDERYFTVKWS